MIQIAPRNLAHFVLGAHDHRELLVSWSRPGPVTDKDGEEIRRNRRCRWRPSIRGGGGTARTVRRCKTVCEWGGLVAGGRGSRQRFSRRAPACRRDARGSRPRRPSARPGHGPIPETRRSSPEVVRGAVGASIKSVGTSSSAWASVNRRRAIPVARLAHAVGHTRSGSDG